MVGQIMEDARRMVLGLLFVVAFGWMAAQIVPGSEPGGEVGQQVASIAVVIAPNP